MRFDIENTPALWRLFHKFGPESKRIHRRIIEISKDGQPDDELLAEAANELNPIILDALTASQLETLGRFAWAAERKSGQFQSLLRTLRDAFDRRWGDLAPRIAMMAVLLRDRRTFILNAFPRLSASTEMIDAIGDAAESDDLLFLNRDMDLLALASPSRMKLRKYLPRTKGRVGDNLAVYFLIAAARAEGWTPWLKLFAVLIAMPDLAGDGHANEPVLADYYDFEEGVAARRQVWDVVSRDLQVREAAQLVRDLDGALAFSPADLRSVFVNRLRVTIGDDSDLRHASIEALLWIGRERQRDLALYAAVSLAEPEDAALLDELTHHPNRETQYLAQLVRDTILGQNSDDGAWPLPTRSGIAEGLFQMRLAQSGDGEESRTWIGHRLLERMIEHTAASLEEEFTREYPHHHGLGEEKLAERFFTKLSSQFDILDRGLLETSRAVGTGRRTSVQVRYRSVDKAEEGSPGIKGRGQADEAPTFSADICLIVNAVLDGKPLAHRASLIQAKRLYAKDKNDLSKGWNHSFLLKPKQTVDLLRQTEASFYLFEAPVLSGRGLSVIPARLVNDLAIHQQPSGAVLAAHTVGRASQSFAEWFTYEVVALRTGDSFPELLNKAGRGPGSTPYDLVRLGVVEIEVSVGAREKPEA